MKSITQLLLIWFIPPTPYNSLTIVKKWKFQDTSVVQVGGTWQSQDSAPAKIGLLYNTQNVLWLMNRFGTTGHADRLNQWGIHNRHHAHHFRSLMGHENCLLLNLVVRKSKVFVQFVVLHEPIFGSNFATFDLFFARIRGFAFWMVEPLSLRRTSKFRTWLPWLCRTLDVHTTSGWKCKIWTAIEAWCYENEKKEAEGCDARGMFGVTLSLDPCLVFKALDVNWRKMSRLIMLPPTPVWRGWEGFGFGEVVTPPPNPQTPNPKLVWGLRK